MLMKDQKGFSAVILLITFVIIATIGFSGWLIWQSKAKNTHQQAVTDATRRKITTVNNLLSSAQIEALNDWYVLVGCGVKEGYGDYYVNNVDKEISDEQAVRLKEKAIAKGYTIDNYGLKINPPRESYIMTKDDLKFGIAYLDNDQKTKLVPFIQVEIPVAEPPKEFRKVPSYCD